eukprot:6051464-Amphidinium_carterae.4
MGCLHISDSSCCRASACSANAGSGKDEIQDIIDNVWPCTASWSCRRRNHFCSPTQPLQWSGMRARLRGYTHTIPLDEVHELWGVPASDWAAFKAAPLVVVEPHVLAALIARGSWSCVLTRAVSLNRWRLTTDVLARFQQLGHPPRTWVESVPSHEHVSGQSLHRSFSSGIASDIADLLRKHSGVILRSSAEESRDDVHWNLNEMILALDTFHDQTDFGGNNFKQFHKSVKQNSCPHSQVVLSNIYAD